MFLSIKGHSVVVVDKVDEALFYLITETWDVLFLDHDLGYDKTGYTLACELERMSKEGGKDFSPPQIYIHSANSIGAMNIMKALPNAKRWDFLSVASCIKNNCLL